VTTVVLDGASAVIVAAAFERKAGGTTVPAPVPGQVRWAIAVGLIAAERTVGHRPTTPAPNAAALDAERAFLYGDRPPS